MDIDARNETLDDLFQQLREHLSCNMGKEIDLDILLNSEADAKKVKTFVSMSGCKSEIVRKGDHIAMHVTGYPCCA